MLITHKLREALGVADEVTVLRRGRTVLTATRDEVTPDTLTVAMIGEELTGANRDHSPATRGPRRRPAPVFRADEADARRRRAAAPACVDATFEISAGEIVGIAAVEGSGQRELLRALAGRLDRRVGRARASTVWSASCLRTAITMPCFSIAASRKTSRFAAPAVRRGMIDWNAVGCAHRAPHAGYDVRAESTGVPMRTLSGGNQQKLVLARELELERRCRSRALVVENPTRGLDVRATAEVHARLRRAALDGAAIVLYSSDIDEVLLLATRVFVVFERVVRELPLDRERIGQAMVGAA